MLPLKQEAGSMDISYHRREMLEVLTLGTVLSGPSSRDIWELGLMAHEWGGGTEGNEV